MKLKLKPERVMLGLYVLAAPCFYDLFVRLQSEFVGETGEVGESHGT